MAYATQVVSEFGTWYLADAAGGLVAGPFVSQAAAQAALPAYVAPASAAPATPAPAPSETPGPPVLVQEG